MKMKTNAKIIMSDHSDKGRYCVASYHINNYNFKKEDLK